MRGAGAEDAGFLGRDRKRAGVSATHQPFAAHSLRKKMERMTRLELATSTLARSRSTR